MSFGHFGFDAFRFGAVTVESSEQAFDLMWVSDDRATVRTVKCLPVGGVIADPLEVTEIPAYLPAITGARLLGDNTWSLVDADGVSITDALISSEEAGENLFVNPEAPATQSITVEAIEHTLSITGTGDITVSGVASGTATEGSSLTFTPTAGTLTCTVTGTVTTAQLETGPIATSFMTTSRDADIYSIPTPSVMTAEHGAFEIVMNLTKDPDPNDMIFSFYVDADNSFYGYFQSLTTIGLRNKVAGVNTANDFAITVAEGDSVRVRVYWDKRSGHLGTIGIIAAMAADDISLVSFSPTVIADQVSFNATAMENGNRDGSYVVSTEYPLADLKFYKSVQAAGWSVSDIPFDGETVTFGGDSVTFDGDPAVTFGEI